MFDYRSTCCSDIEIIDIDTILPRPSSVGKCASSSTAIYHKLAQIRRSLSNRPEQLYAGRVLTDFMTPHYQPGDIIIFDPYAELTPGSHVIVQHNSTLTIGAATEDGEAVDADARHYLGEVTVIAAVVGNFTAMW